ncbi:MAG: SDR family NAD(P)-dependent oxidoreductase [Planctomycetota bacterium]
MAAKPIDVSTTESEDSRKTYLVTGAAGFIASRVSAQLLEAGHRVVGIDNLNDYYSPALKQHRLESLEPSPRFSFHPIDVEDRDSINRLFDTHEFAGVFNLAARAGVRASLENPHIYYSTNQGGTLNLLEAMRTHDVKKFVLASTSSLYAGQKMPFVESMPVNEPISPYAASKKAAEVTAYTWHYLHGIDVSVVRYFTVYGPCGRPDMSPFRFFHWIKTGRPIQLFGDGSQQRDFTYVDCVARGTIAALKPVGYEIFNIGNEHPHSIREMISTMEKLVGKPANIEYLPAHPTDMPATWSDSRKAREILGWTPTTSFEEGLEKTWAWHHGGIEQFTMQTV